MVRCKARLKNWDLTGHLLHVMRPRIEEESDKVMQECEQLYYNEVIRLATEGLPDWPPLTSEWVSYKGHDVFYYYKGQFLEEGIEFRRVKAAPGQEKAFIGASPYRWHRHGIRMDRLAMRLQYDYDRPLFGPAWENVKEEISRKLANIGVNILK